MWRNLSCWEIASRFVDAVCCRSVVLISEKLFLYPVMFLTCCQLTWLDAASFSSCFFFTFQAFVDPSQPFHKTLKWPLFNISNVFCVSLWIKKVVTSFHTVSTCFWISAALIFQMLKQQQYQSCCLWKVWLCFTEQDPAPDATYSLLERTTANSQYESNVIRGMKRFLLHSL